jgi:hypothetical protein
MKLKSILFSAFMLSSFIMMAQDWSSDVYKMGELYPGYIVDASGKKTEGFIKYDNRYDMQNDVLFYTDKADKKSKVKYATADLKEYMVADKLYHCIHYSGGLLAKPIRANLVVKEGCITEYVWYDRNEAYMTMTRGSGESEEDYYARMYPPTQVFLKDGDEDAKTIASLALKFAEKMSEWISDNAALSEKVATKEKGYGALNMLYVIEEYNTNCTK